jgi:hypothetical protein
VNFRDRRKGEREERGGRGGKGEGQGNEGKEREEKKDNLLQATSVGSQTLVKGDSIPF